MAGADQLAAQLARRARETPATPWLFFRQGFDWRWRSWARVADQVARGADRCRRWSQTQGERSLKVSTVWHPDAVAGCLAVAAAGLEVDLDGASSSEAGACTLALPSPEGDGDGDGKHDGDGDFSSGSSPTLPSCHGALDAFEGATLEVAAGDSGLLLEGETWPWSRIDASRKHFGALGQALGAPLDLEAGRGKKKQLILLASGSLPPSLFVTLLAWSLHTGASWILEPDPDELAGVAWWSRPSILVATADELEAFAAHFDRSARKRSRLTALVSIDRAIEEIDARRFGAPVFRLDPPEAA